MVDFDKWIIILFMALGSGSDQIKEQQSIPLDVIPWYDDWSPHGVRSRRESESQADEKIINDNILDSIWSLLDEQESKKKSLTKNKDADGNNEAKTRMLLYSATTYGNLCAIVIFIGIAVVCLLFRGCTLISKFHAFFMEYGKHNHK